MPQALQVLRFELWEVRLVMRGEEPWFVLVDVCEVLGIANARDAAARLDADERGVAITDTPGGPQEVLTISEPGLYSMVGRSRKPAARRFDRWVRHDVLPQIRRTGSYLGPMLPLEQLFDAKLAPMQQEITRQGHRLTVIEGGLSELKTTTAQIAPRLEQQISPHLTELKRAVEEAAPRQDFPPKVTAQWLRCLRRYFNAACPICLDVALVTDTSDRGMWIKDGLNRRAQFHHLYAPRKVGLYEGLPCCADCHADLDKKERDLGTKIEAFLDRLRDLSSTPGQGRLF